MSDGFTTNRKRKLAAASVGEDTAEARANGAKLKRDSAAEVQQDLDLDHAYAQRAKKQKSKETSRLPIKTSEGWKQLETVGVDLAEQDVESFLDSEDEPEQGSETEGTEEDTEPAIPAKQQIREAKEELARLAGLLNEDPEEHLASLKGLGKIAASKNPTVKKLALATQCAVYKDIIPGYRIRSWGEDDVGGKLSKEVRKLRAYEQALVSGYQTYVQELEKLAKGAKDAGQLSSVALACACTLLLEVPHFNFRGDLVKIIVRQVSRRRMDAESEKCVQTLEKLFEQDEDGRVSLDAVSQLTKMVKARNYTVHESVLNTFLHLRLLSEFRSKASHERVDKIEEEPIKQSKKERKFLTKRERKQRKERKALDKELKEADAVVSHEERDKMQAEMLKLVFATYFRILKAGTPSLMGAVLEGLARYAHLINQDFFGDILEALKDLINDTDKEYEEAVEETEAPIRNFTRESLLCAITAFALLEGQDASKAATSLHLDLNFFISHLYRTLYPVALNADIELCSRSLRLADPHSSASTPKEMKVNAQTTTVLLIRCLSSVLLPPVAIRSVPPLRLAAFTKQLMTACLQLPEKSCLAMLSLLTSVSKVHGRKIAALWNTEERRGDGVFDATRAEYESSNPFASTVWEGDLLKRHYCPKVREQAKQLERNIKDSN